MIPVAVDLHIHSCLSPCSTMDMTPNNIVNMAKLKGLDIIAVCDHNHTGNLTAVSQVAKENGILLLPGLELETSEEIHLLCYFPSLEKALQMQPILDAYSQFIQNREDIFGPQWIMNSQDEPLEKIPHLLATSTKMDIYQAVSSVRALGGIVIPAHIDRESYSIVNTLGLIPPDLQFNTLELSKCTPKQTFLEKYPEYESYLFLSSSDAHDLAMILEKEFFIVLETVSLSCLVEKLEKGL